MKKALVNLLVVLILFLSGYNSALLAVEPQVDEPQEVQITSLQIQNHLSETVTASLYVAKSRHHLEPYEVELEEEDDERSSSFKRYSHTGKYFIVVCLALLLGYFHNLTKKRSPSSEPSYYFSLDKKFILFQVFRI
ncbi:MAG: hypothetical protein HWE21_15680 [Cytophagia bacterium]|nr:hypothetical protein [Cytophagia bacterium]